MDVEFIIINVLGVFFQALILERVFSCMEEERKCNKYLRIAMYGLFVASCSAVTCLVKIPIVQGSVLLLLSICVSFTYNISWFKKASICLGMTILFILSEMLMGLMLSAISSESIESIQGNIIAYTQGVLGSKLIVFFIVLILRRILTKNATKLAKGMYASIIILPIISNLIIFAISEFSYENSNQTLKGLSIAGVVCLIVSNVILMYIIEKYIEGVVQSAEDKTKNNELSQATTYYIELIEKYKFANKKMHDIDNQLLIIKNLAILDRDLYNEEILKVEGLLSEAKNISYSGIIAIDALLNNKFNIASNIGIEIDKKVFIEKIDGSRQMDICLVLGNVLDNAIEECERLIALGLKAKIKLTLNQVKDFVQIEVENSMIKVTNQGSVSKKTKYHHGYGNQIVKELVEKYNGSLIKEIDKNRHNVSILM